MGLAFSPSPPLSPEFAGELPDTSLASAMAAHLRAIRPGSGAEALRSLRRAFPNAPLTLRVAALSALMRR